MQQKQAVEALYEIEERHRAILQSAMDGFWLVDMRGHLLEVNENYCRMSGYSRPELLAMCISDLEAAETTENIAAHIQKIVAEGEDRFESRHRRKDGSVFDVEVSVQYRPLEGGRFVGFLRDITKRKQDESQLLLHSGILENMAEGVYLIRTRDGEIVYANQKFECMFGYNSGELVGKHVSIVNAPGRKSPEETAKEIIQRLNADGVWQGEVQNIRKDGSIFWCHANVSTFEHPKYGNVWISIHQDITKRKSVEDALVKSNDSLQAIIDNMDEVVYVADIQTYEILLINKYVRNMFGDIVGKSCWQTIQKGQSGPCSFCSNSKLIGTNGEFLDTYIWYFQNTSNHRWYECRDRAIRWIDGRIVRLEIAADITERKQAEEKAKALEVTELANKAKDTFLATMSHEMRTPLQSIISYQALLSRTRLTEEQKQYLTLINNSAELLRTLINDILDLTRIEQGNLHINCMLFDVRELLTNTLEIHRPEAQSKVLALDCLIAGDVPSRLKGDPDRLRQILHNLIGNAIKFTEKGGINIEVENKSDCGVSGGVCDGVELLFRVRDSGIGITKDKIEVIFDSFKQAHEGYSRQYGGVGLGLSISRKLLQHMGGSMWVESEPNKGSTFYFTAKFDIAGADEDAGASLVKAEAAIIDESRRKKKVLIVDDEIQCLSAMEIMLKSDGNEVTTACSGTEALARLKLEEFDLIFMDVSMPYIDGIEVTKMIREEEKGTGKHTPIIALTGHGYDSDIARFKEAGMDMWLIKPAVYDDLVKILYNCHNS